VFCVEDPAREGDAVEEKIGVVTDYLNRIGVAVILLTDGDLHVGDKVHIAGRTTEHTQWVESLQIEREAVAEAPRGSEVAMRVEAPVRRKDDVFRIRAE
jgi:translation initiation factor IF-2